MWENIEILNLTRQKEKETIWFQRSICQRIIPRLSKKSVYNAWWDGAFNYTITKININLVVAIS